ncbi:hypothetical protein FRB90_007486, partial [Tulasnella sp. 427]
AGQQRLRTLSAFWEHLKMVRTKCGADSQESKDASNLLIAVYDILAIVEDLDDASHSRSEKDETEDDHDVPAISPKRMKRVTFLDSERHTESGRTTGGGLASLPGTRSGPASPISGRAAISPSKPQMSPPQSPKKKAKAAATLESLQRKWKAEEMYQQEVNRLRAALRACQKAKGTTVGDLSKLLIAIECSSDRVLGKVAGEAGRINSLALSPLNVPAGRSRRSPGSFRLEYQS